MTHENEWIEKCVQYCTYAGIIFLRLNFPLTGRAIIVEVQIEFMIMTQVGKKTNTGVIAQKHDEKKSTPAYFHSRLH